MCVKCADERLVTYTHISIVLSFHNFCVKIQDVPVNICYFVVSLIRILAPVFYLQGSYLKWNILIISSVQHVHTLVLISP